MFAPAILNSSQNSRMALDFRLSAFLKGGFPCLKSTRAAYFKRNTHTYAIGEQQVDLWHSSNNTRDARTKTDERNLIQTLNRQLAVFVPSRPAKTLFCFVSCSLDVSRNCPAFQRERDMECFGKSFFLQTPVSLWWKYLGLAIEIFAFLILSVVARTTCIKN